MPYRPQKRALARFMAESQSVKTGRYIRTYHDTEERARKRLQGNRCHINQRMIDTQPPKVGK